MCNLAAKLLWPAYSLVTDLGEITMKKTGRSLLLTVLAGCLLSVPANAIIITIDPDDYAPGTNMSSIFADVSFGAFTGSGSLFTMGDVYALEDPACAVRPDDCFAITGTQVFGRFSSGQFGVSQLTWFDSPTAANCLPALLANRCPSLNFAALVINFRNPTNYVEISGAYMADSPLLYAFDASLNRIGSGGALGPFPGPGEGIYATQTSSFESTTANIAYVVAAGWSASSSLDVLRYNDMSVPEPGTLTLFGLAVVGALAARRRRLTAG